ncbi:hypothetical protein [Sporomusa malonica]|uniref:Uncharacterized protein n=1 Tax=Sporomusa malonica TaxID=112901 RepID=A0A1W1ZSX8_9FIRM|nr:hypothetical protein [Sporomusa malonica]SMC51466.1 hypothetical protein SAMN04488500_104170 [Sporomusa malonica]
MNGLAKKAIIYSMVGIMQVGIFATAAEASALYNNGSGQIVELRSDRHDRDHDRRRHNDERRRQHDERRRIENERHEREMKRRPHESRREWHERQARERDRHDREMREIAALIIGILIGSSND